MRTIAGAVIVLAGLGGLGWWATVRQADVIEQQILQAATALEVPSVHGVDIAVSGRDITLTGIANGPDEAEALLAAYAAVPGQREVRADWTVLPVVSPYVMAARWQEDSFAAEGHVPTQAARAELEPILGSTQSLALGAGAPKDWSAAAKVGLTATRLLEEGEMRLEDQTLILNGIARTPSEGAAIERTLASLPQGYRSESVLDYLDDGTPPEYSITYDASTGLRIDGKLPAGLTADDVSGALNFVAHGGNAQTGLLGDPAGHIDRLKPLAEWLPELERLTIVRTGDELSVVGTVGAGVDAELVAEALTEAVGNPVNLAVGAAQQPDGSLRTNAATGATEVARAGYWLPHVHFNPDIDTCADRMNTELQRNPIQFLTGSARLDAKASRVINAMASVAALCVTDGNLRAEIGGHTDSVGDPASNRALSEARANAVRAALIARGVASRALVANGYGESDPIETNDTEEGRAANRRTTVIWSPSDDGVN